MLCLREAKRRLRVKRQKMDVAELGFLQMVLKEICPNCSLWCLYDGWQLSPTYLSLALCLSTGHCEKQITLDSEARIQDKIPLLILSLSLPHVADNVAFTSLGDFPQEIVKI